MSPAAGGAAPAQSAPEPNRAPARRDPPGQAEGADPANAVARKTAWSVPAPPPAAAASASAATPGGSIIGGDASWPALTESTRAWPKPASSDSLKSLSDGSGPSAQEDSIASPVPPHPVVEVNPISSGSNPISTPPPNAAAAASSQQNGATAQPNPVRRSGTNGGNNGGGSRGNGSSGGRRAASSSGGDGSSGSGGDGNWNDGSLGSGRGCNSSNGDGGINLNDNVSGGGTSGSGNDSSRNALGNNNWNNNIRGVGGSSSNSTGNGDGNNRSSGGSSNHWSNNARNSSGTSNGVGGRGGYRSRRDHERGGNFSPRNYPRVPIMPYQQQQQPPPVAYQPGPFPQPSAPPAAQFMVPPHFVPYVPPFAYRGDVQSYPLYFPPVEQFQNMHLVRPPMQPSWVPQDQPNLHEDIRMQIEFYFSTNNLCHDTFLRRHMNDQGWVPIDLILGFNRMRQFTGLVDTNYILDAIRGSEILEVQGNNVRRRNDWAEWLLH
ncbi:la-related protein 1B-like [Phragmites australis]|uniref:la-related protein 1B-like n=1 Tax=Phragmites australis TaxID=29695 RepID=UPI002D787AD2|nr:la-related protein 1B-like [Phragmites australis]